MTGGDLLIECLKAQGVRCLFGIPGTQNLAIYDSLRRCAGGAIDHYLVRHEYAATILADGYARSTGEVGVALTVPGPGASNASTGVLEAYTDRVPVLLITGQHDTSLYSRDPSKKFHGLDQMSFFEPITKYCAIAHTASDVPRVVEEAFRAMRSGRPGPAMLEFPQDAITGEAGSVEVPARVQPDAAGTPDPGLVGDAAAAVGGMRRPLLLAGKAVIDGGAREELRLLAEKLGAPVVTTRLGKGALREDHPLALADARGYLGTSAMDAADGTVAVGVRFTSIDTRSWNDDYPRPLIQLDPEATEIGREYECDVGLSGDLKASLRALTDAVSSGSGEWEQVLPPHRQRFAAQPPLPLLPQIRRVLPEDGILTVDVHGIGYSTFAEYPIYDPRTFLYPCIGVSLGHAFPQALGAKVAHPERPVVAFCGDGGFLMGSCELSTAVRYGIAVVVVVVNDGALTAIKGSQVKHYGGRTIDTDLTNPDFVAFAESFGAWARRVDDLGDGFEATLREALESGRPALIEVPLGDRQNEAMGWITWLRDDPLRA